MESWDEILFRLSPGRLTSLMQVGVFDVGLLLFYLLMIAMFAICLVRIFAKGKYHKLFNVLSAATSIVIWLTLGMVLMQVGVFDVRLLLFYLLVIATFAICSVRIFTKGKYHKLFNVLDSATCIVVLLVLGMVLPSPYLDLSAGKLVTPFEQTKTALAQIAQTHDDQVVARLVAPAGQVDAKLDMLLNNLRWIGSFNYQPEMFEEDFEDAGDLAPNILVLWRGSTRTVIPYERLVVENPAAAEEPKQVINVEAELVQCITQWDALSDEHIYRLAGPQDEAYPDVLYDVIRTLTQQDVNVLDLTKAVPKDARIVLIDNPQEDLTELEANLIQSYLGRGGRLLLLTDYIHGAMPNLNMALSEYGLSAIDGVVFDGGSSMGGHPEYPMPSLGEHVISKTLTSAKRMPLMPLSHAISVEKLSEVEAENLLVTTDQAYLQLNNIEHTSLSKGEQDLEGPFGLAVAAQSGNGKVVWIASGDMALATSDGDVGGANSDLLRASMLWLMDALIDPIPAKPL